MASAIAVMGYVSENLEWLVLSDNVELQGPEYYDECIFANTGMVTWSCKRQHGDMVLSDVVSPFARKSQVG
ncbi:hypothetical protein E4U23_007862 [Claviceps purpurea]|nr:hypothetical protein E4U23_007862 [Claviceps purpurea]